MDCIGKGITFAPALREKHGIVLVADLVIEVYRKVMKKDVINDPKFNRNLF